jgi:hypothetical protein
MDKDQITVNIDRNNPEEYVFGTSFLPTVVDGLRISSKGSDLRENGSSIRAEYKGVKWDGNDLRIVAERFDPSTRKSRE